MTTSAPARCERCGSILVIFEEHGDEGVIYCACACATSPAVRPSAVAARSARVPGRCRICRAELVVVGHRPDGSPIEAECPCQQPPYLHHDRRVTERRSPRETQPSSGGGSFVMVGAVVLVVAAALAGYMTRGKSEANITHAPPKIAAPPELDLAPVAEAPASQQPGGVEIRSDESGSVTLVSGSDPGAVLRAFCRHPQFKSALVPGSIQSTTPPDPDLLLGSAVLMDGVGSPRQVILKRDPATNRWSIGDGRAAIAK